MNKMMFPRTSLLIVAVGLVGCGEMVINDTPSSNQPIVGGVVSAAGARTYQVSLQTSYGSHFCGGALISSQWVLTAAHCVVSKSASSVIVRVGSNMRSSGGQLVGVSQIIVHPSYSSYTSRNDIALVKLSASASSAYTPLVLPSEQLMTQAFGPGTLATVSGYGSTSEGGYGSSYLREVDVPIVANSVCNASYAYNGAVYSTMLCAGYPSGGKDSCSGDSGGPLVIAHQGQRFSAGVVSWGYGCARPYRYGVYTRTASFTGWIASWTGIQPHGSGSSSSAVCGDGKVGTGETCDSTSVSCASLSSNYVSGVASCNATCTGWSTSACVLQQASAQTLVESGSVLQDHYAIFKNAWIKAGAGPFKAVVSGTGDVDLYVWKNVTSPTWSNFTCRPYIDGSAESCSLSGPGSFLVAVRGFAASSTYQVVVTYTAN
jgi:secreted trypsin-like serine protease